MKEETLKEILINIECIRKLLDDINQKLAVSADATATEASSMSLDIINQETAYAKLDDFLMSIHIARYLKGYEYLKYALFLYIFEDYKSRSMTRDLYPDIARKYDVDYHNVERGMRFAINQAWKKSELARTPLGNLFIGYAKCPTNREFLVVISEAIKSGALRI